MSHCFSRLAVLTLGSQLVLVLGVLVLCDVETKRQQMHLYGRFPSGIPIGLLPLSVGQGHIFRGFPIPWSETAGHAYYIGYNLAVPAVLLVLAVCVPILVAAEQKRCREANAARVPRTNGVRALWATVGAASVGTALAHSWCDWAVPAFLCVLAVCVPLLVLFELKRPWKRNAVWGVRTRRIRALWVIVIAASTGAAVSFVDVVTDPMSHGNGGIGNVPFHYIPGRWLMIPSGSTTPASDSLPIQWIRRTRGELFGTYGTAREAEYAAAAWDRRTLRTLLGIGFGFLLGGWTSRK